MNEWKELKIDNLPPDILTGGYRFEFYSKIDRIWIRSAVTIMELLNYIFIGEFEYRYRKPEPKAPSHKGIQISNEAKDRITGNLFYLFHQFMTQEPLTKAIDIQHRLNLTRDAITNVLESATIPPEEKS